jgi:hypothetical protein
VYDRRAGKQELTFGVSGKLYNSNVLIYDHQTESLWSQIKEEAVTGPLTGTKLRALPSTMTTWKRWRRDHPDTLVLSTRTGYRRDYDHDPYDGYDTSAGVYFPVKHQDPRLHPKERVLGIAVGGESKAFPLRSLAVLSKPLIDTVGGKKFAITYEPEGESAAAIESETGKPYPAVTAYWFAWVTFHPETAIYHAPAPRSPTRGGSGFSEGSH